MSRTDAPEEVRKGQGLDGTNYRIMYYPDETNPYWVEVKVDGDWHVVVLGDDSTGRFRAFRDALEVFEERLK